jgi:hypothetical protein
MSSPNDLVTVYRELAEWNDRLGQAQARDRFLVLAADAALCAGLDAEAELLRQRLLKLSPHHMLRPFASFAEALSSPDVQGYVGELRRSWPPAAAEEMLAKIRARGAPPRPARGIPPTTPVLDLDEPPAPEPLKVYRDQDADAPPRKPAAPPPPRPKQTGLPRPAAPPARPVRPPAPPLVPVGQPRHHPGRGEENAGDPEEAGTGAWLSVTLFVLVLIAGVALAGYTLVGPFLKP